MHSLNRRLVLLLVVSITQSIEMAGGQEAQYVKSTEVYKTVGDLAIHADVYRPPGKRVLPVVVLTPVR